MLDVYNYRLILVKKPKCKSSGKVLPVALFKFQIPLLSVPLYFCCLIYNFDPIKVAFIAIPYCLLVCQHSALCTLISVFVPHILTISTRTACLQYNYIFLIIIVPVPAIIEAPAREVDLYFGVDSLRFRYVNYTLRWVAYKLRCNWVECSAFLGPFRHKKRGCFCGNTFTRSWAGFWGNPRLHLVLPQCARSRPT